jgi:hypothetical protein
MEKQHASDASRRNFIKRAGTASLATMGAMAMAPGVATAAPSAAAGAQMARGRVFHDANRSGRADGQHGLPGVLVCNGVDIAVTDAQGHYELPVTTDCVIYVIKPRDYMTAVDDLMLPRYYHLHKPAGTPDADFIYKGVAPTGPLPDSVDFPLYHKPEPDNFAVLITADPQPYDLQHLLWYGEETTREFKALDVACGIALGDIAGNNLDLFDPYNRISAHCGFPWYNVLGNHDINFMAKDDTHADATFQRVYGPSTYAFQRGPVHFIVLNNVYWEGYAGLRPDGWPLRTPYRGHLRPWQLQFIRNYLRHVPRRDRIVLCSHIPLINLPHYSTSNAHTTPEFAELLEILSSHPYTMSFSGHTHINMNYLVGEAHGYRAPGGALHHHCNITATCGCWYYGPYDVAGIPFAPGRDGAPRGYAVVSFNGGAHYRIRYKALGHAEDFQTRLTLPGMIRRAELAATPVHVNVFNGTTRTRARMRIDAGPWLELRQTMTVDPAYVALVERNRRHPEAGAGPLEPALATDHNWVGALPGDLAPGWHSVHIEVTSHDGEIFTDGQTFVVVDDPAELAPLDHSTRRRRDA